MDGIGLDEKTSERLEVDMCNCKLRLRVRMSVCCIVALFRPVSKLETSRVSVLKEEKSSLVVSGDGMWCWRAGGAMVPFVALLISKLRSVCNARMTASLIVSCESGCRGVHMPLFT